MAETGQMTAAGEWSHISLNGAVALVTGGDSRGDSGDS